MKQSVNFRIPAFVALSLCAALSCSKPLGEAPGETGGSGDITFPGSTEGDYTVSRIFSDGMVLQQNAEISVFGKADRGRAITVQGSWSEEKVTVYPYLDGNYIAKIRTPEAGGPYTLSVNDSLYTDVMIGEVWLCSGQSNMQLRVSQTNKLGLFNENNPNIRMFTIPMQSTAKEPLDTLSGGEWYYGPINDIQGQVSAVGYYFARKLQNELNVPVGMVFSARGSTGAEEWLNAEIFNSLPQEIRDPFTTTVDPAEKWAGRWYNAMICPIFNYKITGTIWYQGENNSSRPDSYPVLMSELVGDWRRNFNNTDMPFYMVQLPAFKRDWWPEFRIVQEKTAEGIDNCKFITSIDTGEENNIHPKRKLEIGERLGELALANVYGRKEFRADPPVFDRMEKAGSTITVYYRNVSGLKLTSGESPLHFEICGSDGVFHPADAEISGSNSISLSSADVPAPSGARYFWLGFAKPNIATEDGWPLAPFNTMLE